MAERPPHEADQVMDYLLGQLTPAARRQFEARLESDAALREYVRELEQGVLALGMTAPSRDVPPEAWARIEAAVARQVRRETWLPFLRPGWLTGGWAVASLAVVALIAQWFWFHSSAGIPPSPAANPVVASHLQIKPAQPEETQVTPSPALTTSLPVETPAESAQTAELRQKVARLEAQLARLSQSVTQPPPAAVAAPARGLQLLPPVGVPRGTANLSPQLQQAVLLAVARKMGWTLNPPASDAGTGASQDNAPAVDFVDLNAPTNAAAGALPTVTVSAPISTTTDSFAFAAAPPVSSTPAETTANPVTSNINGYGGSVPMLAWGNQIMAAIDPGTLPTNSGPVTVWQMDGYGNGQIIGTVALGSNPTVVNFSSDPSQSYLVTMGGTNIIGQFPSGN